MLTSVAVVAIIGVFVSAASNPNGLPPKEEKTSTKYLKSDVPKLWKVRDAPRPVLPLPKAQNASQTVFNAYSKEVKQPVPEPLAQLGSITSNSMDISCPSPTPKMIPSPIPQEILPTLPTTSNTPYVPNPAVKSNNFTDENLQAALPQTLYRSISQFGNAGDVIKKHLQVFFGILHKKEKSADLNRVFNYVIANTVNKISVEVSSQTDTKCNIELLSSLDIFLRCYTAVFMVCDAVQRQDLFINGFIRIIKDFIVFVNSEGKQFDKLLKMVQLKKAGRHQLCLSFIRFFRLLISTKIIADDIEEQVKHLLNEFELFVKKTKGKQDIKSPLVFGEVLTLGFKNLKALQKVSPRYAYATDTDSEKAYIPSMMIAPFRI